MNAQDNKLSKKWIGMATVLLSVATANAALFFSDNFNGDDNATSVNGNLAIRQSGALATKYYARPTEALTGYQIKGGKLYHEKGATSAQFFLSTTAAIADANSRVDLYNSLAGKKYEIEAKLWVSSASTAISDYFRFYYSDQATTTDVEFQIEQIRASGNVRLNVEGTQTHAANTAANAENTLKLVVDETGAQTTYEFFVNGVSKNSGTMTFESNERHLWFQTSGGATATMDDLIITVIPDPATCVSTPAFAAEMSAVEKQVDAVLQQMTLKEKVRLCMGAGITAMHGVPRLGIPNMIFSDGPRGTHAGRKVGVDGETAFPAGPGQSAAWNVELMEIMGSVIGRESLANNVTISGGPALNILRDPLGGRWFEYYSEDPYLSGAMTAPVVKGIQKNRVAACLKHYVANNREDNRNNYMSMIDERTLQEIYLPAFRMGVEAGAWTVMTAANGVNGDFVSDSHYLLQEILKDQWGFDGCVLTDWLQTRSCEKAALAGLDISMPFAGNEDAYQKHPFGGRLLQAVQEGRVPLAVIEDKARRILRVFARTGLLDGSKPSGEMNTAEHHQAARQMAEESMVLLKNINGFLPLDRQKVKKILVVGPNSDRRFCLVGLGGSSWVESPYEVTALAGIRHAAGSLVDVQYVDAGELMGFRTITAEDTVPGPDGKRGFKAVYSNSGVKQPVLTRQEEEINFLWEMRSPDIEKVESDHFRATFTAQLMPRTTGHYTLRITADDNAELRAQPIGGTPLAVMEKGANSSTANVFMEEGKPFFIRIEYQEKTGDAFCHLEWAPPAESKNRMAGMAKIAELARAVDAVVFVGGIDHVLDTEGRDRKNLNFPLEQKQLIQTLVTANKSTVVVLINGSPLEIGDWVGQSPALLEAWYPGMEGGTAIGKILFGDVNPSGKLPFTWPNTLAESPAHAVGTQTVDRIDYKEGIYVGYRYYDQQKLKPQFPFGFGLSYTTFSYKDLNVEKSKDSKAPVTATVTVKNTGKVAGKEVVQVYVSDVKSSIDQPVKELAGFAKVELKPGESKTVVIPLHWTAFQFFDVGSKHWKLEPGEFIVRAGGSSDDLPLKQKIEL